MDKRSCFNVLLLCVLAHHIHSLVNAAESTLEPTGARQDPESKLLFGLISTKARTWASNALFQNLTKNVTWLVGNVTGLQKSINELQNQIELLNASVTSLQEKLAALKKNLTMLRECPSGVNGKVFDNLCIQFVKKGKSFEAADTDCKSRKGRLFEPNLGNDVLLKMLREAFAVKNRLANFVGIVIDSSAQVFYKNSMVRLLQTHPRIQTTLPPAAGSVKGFAMTYNPAAMTWALTVPSQTTKSYFCEYNLV